jgi:hypothetical protein
MRNWEFAFGTQIVFLWNCEGLSGLPIELGLVVAAWLGVARVKYQYPSEILTVCFENAKVLMDAAYLGS